MTQIDLVTGLLGSGKTTFLVKYGKWLDEHGISYALIENEFGAPGIDSALLKSESGVHVEEIAGGCICCTLKVSFHTLIKELSKKYNRILVEPFGVFRMDDYFDIVNSLAREGVCVPGMAITVVDPHMLNNLCDEEMRLLRDELTSTSAVLWSKMDLYPPVETKLWEEQLHALVRPLDIWPRAMHQLDGEDFAAMSVLEPIHRQHARSSVDHSSIYQSTIISIEGFFERENLVGALQRLCSGEYGQVLRVKGFLNTPDGGSWAVNCAVGSILVERTTKYTARMNIIGRSLQRRGMNALLKSCMTASAI